MSAWPAWPGHERVLGQRPGGLGHLDAQHEVVHLDAALGVDVDGAEDLRVLALEVVVDPAHVRLRPTRSRGDEARWMWIWPPYFMSSARLKLAPEGS